MSTTFQFSAVLLAGGRSTRMGRDKAGLLLGSQTLWERQARLLKSLSPREFFISGRLEADYAHSGEEIIGDACEGAGPLGGIVAALRRSTSQWTLVLAVDMPAISAAVLRDLLAHAAEKGCGCVPRIGDRYEPLAAVYSRQMLTLAEQSLRDGQFALQRLWSQATKGALAVEYVIPSAEHHAFLNVNTLAEFEAVLAEDRRE